MKQSKRILANSASAPVRYERRKTKFYFLGGLTMRNKKTYVRNLKRFLGLLLTLCMALALMSTTVFAVPTKPVIQSAKAFANNGGWQKFTVTATGQDLQYQWQIGYYQGPISGDTWVILKAPRPAPLHRNRLEVHIDGHHFARRHLVLRPG